MVSRGSGDPLGVVDGSLVVSFVVSVDVVVVSPGSGSTLMLSIEEPILAENPKYPQSAGGTNAKADNARVPL